MAPVYISAGQYGCPYCTKVMKQSSDMRRHILIHTGEKPFICRICDYRSAQCGNLKAHMRTMHNL